MPSKDDKSPKKRSTKKDPGEKRVTRKRSVKSDDEEYMDDGTRKKITAALQANLAEYAKKKDLTQKQAAVINSFIEEHLSCFVLLGYTVGGDPVTVINAVTQKDSDSLGTLLQKFLTKYIDIPPPMPPGSY